MGGPAAIDWEGVAQVSHDGGWVRALPLAELQAREMAVVQADRPVVLFWHADAAFALDNRCPHMFR